MRERLRLLLLLAVLLLAAHDGATLQAQVCTSAPSGLTGWWPLDGGGQEIAGANPGTLQGSGAQFVPAVVGSGFKSGGGGSFLLVNDAPALDVTQFTIDAWIRLDAVNTHNMSVIYKGNTAGANISTPYNLFVTGNTPTSVTPGGTITGTYAPRKLAILVSNSAVEHIVLSNAVLPLGVFVHVAATVSGSQVALYIDGQLDRIAAQILVPFANPLPVSIGSYSGTVAYFNGVIDELELFNRALTLTEIQAIFDAGSAGKCRPECTLAPSGMVSWWPADAHSSDIIDSNHGSLRNGATFGSGLVGQQFTLDGVNDYIEVPDSPSLTPPSMTLDAWVNPATVSTAAEGRVILSKYNSNNPSINGVSWVLVMLNTGRLRFVVYQDTPGSIARGVDTSGSVLAAGVWTHVAATFDSGTQVMTIYVNGSAVPSSLIPGAGSTVTSIADSATPLRIGTYVNGVGQFVGFWSGMIDEAELFNRALTASEIFAIFSSGSAGKCKPSFMPSAATFTSVWSGSTGLFPDGACPTWALTDDAMPQDPTLQGGQLSISTSGSFTQNMSYRQADQELAIPDPFVIEFSGRFVSGASGDSSRSAMHVQFQTGPFVGNLFNIGPDEIFLNVGDLVKGPSAVLDTDGTTHTYRIETTGAGAVTIFYDGAFALAGSTFFNASTQPFKVIIWGEQSGFAYGASEWKFLQHNAHVDTGTTLCGLGICQHAVANCAGGVFQSCDPLEGASPEICNALDDDCDGTTDEEYASVTTSCGVGTCAASGSTSCLGGSVVDSCAPGTAAANDSACNALDDDCDGTTDEEYASVTTSCGVGTCAASGSTSCLGGSVVDSCAPGTAAADDSACNALDDDCDGTVDEEHASVTTSCGVGACTASGSTACVGGSVVDSCAPRTPAVDDSTCNALDDDCDGATDEEYASVTTSCGVGACMASGSAACVGGSVVDSCTPGMPAADDSACNALDDDCDGTTDEEYPSVTTACGVGTCTASGSTACISGSVLDSCTPGTAAADDSACNALDDDCDALTDEEYAPVTTSCGVGACAANGSTSCITGSVADSCTPGTPAADDSACNALDDDCDAAMDEDYVSVATACGSGTCASTGATACDGGMEIDTCEPGVPGAEDVCDGGDNDCDAVTDEGFLTVTAIRHTTGPGSHPPTNTAPISDLRVSVYDRALNGCSGSCGPSDYACWVTSLGCAQVAQGTTNASGQVSFELEPGLYLAIGDGGATKKMGKLVDLACGESKTPDLREIVTANGKVHAGKSSVRTGSYLLVIEPEVVEWSGEAEYYPFIFESLGDWGVMTSVAPPEGFVADHESLSAEVTSETEVLQFVITDVGSDWVPTEVQHRLRHGARREVMRSRVGVRLDPEVARRKGLDPEGYRLDGHGRRIPEGRPDPRFEKPAEIVGWVEPSAADPEWLIKVDVNVEGPVVVRLESGDGRPIRTLAEGRLEPGEHVFAWDGNDAAGKAPRAGGVQIRLTAAGVEDRVSIVPSEGGFAGDPARSRGPKVDPEQPGPGDVLKPRP